MTADKFEINDCIVCEFHVPIQMDDWLLENNFSRDGDGHVMDGMDNIIGAWMHNPGMPWRVNLRRGVKISEDPMTAADYNPEDEWMDEDQGWF